MNSVHVSTTSQQVHGTPQALIMEIEDRFGVQFLLDLAANGENTKAPNFLGEAENSLSLDWKDSLDMLADIGPNSRPPAAWLNPPFRGADPWMEKCKTESAKGMKIISLTLASIGTGWYHNHVQGNALSMVLRERVTFEGQKDPFPKELMVTLWGFGMVGFGTWSRKP
ncbi:MAG: phage N-6-adenine-methyltransferase [Fibrobacterota bacterium]|nr:phage N-6-adenine-methyltransferase [Fibrobacterota bacterium]